MYIDRERWREIQAEFGQDGEPLGHPKVQLTEEALSVEFGDGESQASVWATRQSTRVDVERLQILVHNDTGRVLLLRRVGPYPIQQWDLLYDSDDDWPAWHAGQSIQDATSAAPDVNTAETDSSLELVQQLLVALRAGLGLYYRGTVTETDSAVPLVVDILRAVIADWGASRRVELIERAVQIVRAVRSMVPTR